MHFDIDRQLSYISGKNIGLVRNMDRRLEFAVSGVLLLVAVAFVIFIDNVVAAPKMLLGRSLSAIEPSAFPLVAMVMMIGLCSAFLLTAYRGAAEPVPAQSDIEGRTDWFRVGAFFGILILYALMFDPIGFLISTFVAMVLLSFLAGNRSPFQILILSSAGPIGLYIIATRLLRVSLPELSQIEFAYAMVLGR